MASYSFDRIRVAVWPNKGWRLQWSIEGLGASNEVRIQRSESQEGPWDDVADVPASQVVYEDKNKPYRSHWTVFFYRLQVLDSQKNVEQTSEPTSNMETPGKLTREIARQHQLLLQGVNTHPGFMSRKFACFKRTIDGTRCTDCVDPKTGQRYVDRCSTCGGTGYTEGWSDPIVFQAWFRGSQRREVRMNPRSNESEDLTRRLFLTNWPLLAPGDVLAEKKTGRRWRVRDIEVSDPNGVVVSQRPTIELAHREFIENDLMYPGESP